MSEEFNNVSMYQEPSSNGEGGKGMAIGSMICGIVAIVLSCVWYVSLICGIVAIVLGVMYNKKNGKCGMTTAGIVCGVIGMILAVVLILLAALGLAALGSAAALY
ncbi:MAG: DUF4190 domain-containing protein [Lachnospiraceae bacterium]|nr:DUF4190 domain-containing protein [Lachnospiraceae bacterium]